MSDITSISAQQRLTFRQAPDIVVEAVEGRRLQKRREAIEVSLHDQAIAGVGNVGTNSAECSNGSSEVDTAFGTAGEITYK